MPRPIFALGLAGANRRRQPRTAFSFFSPVHAADVEGHKGSRADDRRASALKAATNRGVTLRAVGDPALVAGGAPEPLKIE